MARLVDLSHVIEAGMVFTIEPMLNLGTPDWVMWDDDWTVLTADGRRSAQFGHSAATDGIDSG